VERAFRILQDQFAIVRGHAKFWDQEILWYIMMACVVMHNMIIENPRGQDLNDFHYELLGQLVFAQPALPASLIATTKSAVNITMKIFRRTSWRSGGHGFRNKGVVVAVQLCDELCGLDFECL
jgi:hypothetical protein